jgi:hypothetical protein
MYLLLGRLLEQDAGQLCLMLAFLGSFIFALRRLGKFSRLNTHALIGSAVAAFFFWEAGGPLWLAGPGVVFIAHIMLASLQRDADELDINAVLSIISCGAVWLFFARESVTPYAYYLFLLSLGIHMQIIILLRIRGLYGKSAEYPLVLAVSLLSAWLFLPLLLLYYPGAADSARAFLPGFLIMAGGGVVLRVRTAGHTGGRWVEQTLYALGGSFLGLASALALA